MVVRGVVASKTPIISFYTESNAQFPIATDLKGRRLASLVGREVELIGDFKRVNGQSQFCVSHYEVMDEVDEWATSLDQEWQNEELEFHEAPARYHWY